MTRKALAVVLCLASFAAMSAVATARLTFDSTIKVYDSPPPFHGRVNSEDGSFCVENRKVKLFKRRDGDDRLLGRDHTNTEGRWKIHFPPPSGVYYARVKELSSASLDVTCRRDKSNLIVID
jgi:hypothetical protein